MNVVVCVKQVPDPNTAGRLDPASHLLQRDGIDAVLDPGDEFGIEAGLRIVEEHGGEVRVVSMGPERAVEAIRKALAMGAAKGVLVSDDGLRGSEALSTAKVLAAAIRREPFDLVITGTESTDGYTGVIPQAGFGVISGVAVAAPFEERSATLGWAFQRVRTGLSLAGTALQERFLQLSTFDLNAAIASAGWLRQLSPTLSIQLQGFESSYHFTELHADTHSTIASLTLAKQFSRVTFSAYAEWLHQSSSVPPGVSLPIALYSDDLVGVNVSYDLIGHHATAVQ